MNEAEQITRYLGFIIALILIFYFNMKRDNKEMEEESRDMK